jgi:hypothetical protein
LSEAETALLLPDCYRTETTVAHYQIFSDDEDSFFDRDAFWYRVRVVRDRKPLGVWLGVVNIRDEDPQHQAHRAATLACAQKIQDMAVHGQLRTEWQFVGVSVIVTEAERDQAGLQLRTDEGNPGELVLEFDA